AASFSISVVVEGELVALIACHHNSPKHIPYSTRRACELIGRHASQRLEHLSADNQRLERAKRLSTQVELLSRLAGESGLSANNEAWSSIAEFVEADAFLVCIGEERTSFSGLSLHEEFWSLGARFAREASDRCRSEVQLGRLDQEAPDGGMLLVPISGFGWVAWFRRAIDRIVVWAGAPSDQAQKTLTPRSSFEAYKQIVRGQCSAWTENEQDIAEVLRRGLNARFVEVESGDSFEQVLRQTREYVEMLEETNQQLTASNEDLRQFAYAASHDFKAPLRTIRSFLPMIENELGDISDRTRSWFNFVNRAADNLQRLQDGLWAFTRVNKDTAFEEVDLNHVVERVLAGIAADFENAVVTVRRLPMAYGIPQQIETVFRNLLENASKYRSPDRQLRVIIEAAHHDAKGVTISVSDNGIGFPPHSEERIFELFSRVHVEHKDGDGLGLAMCRRILHHHGGWIRARGEPGSGATFEMLLRRPEEAPT
ncbi:MAG: ATP-binding protein, partial [Myxococcota bacterium]